MIKLGDKQPIVQLDNGHRIGRVVEVIVAVECLLQNRGVNIDVDVYLGVVTLTGIVGSKYQKERAIHLSRSTEGTVKVVDYLKVR